MVICLIYCHKPSNFIASPTGERRAGRFIEALDRGDMADWIVFHHVERIVCAHDDVVDAERFHQRIKLQRREHHGVEINLLEIAGWSYRFPT